MRGPVQAGPCLHAGHKALQVRFDVARGDGGVAGVHGRHILEACWERGHAFPGIPLPEAERKVRGTPPQEESSLGARGLAGLRPSMGQLRTCRPSSVTRLPPGPGPGGRGRGQAGATRTEGAPAQAPAPQLRGRHATPWARCTPSLQSRCQARDSAGAGLGPGEQPPPAPASVPR